MTRIPQHREEGSLEFSSRRILEHFPSSTSDLPWSYGPPAIEKTEVRLRIIDSRFRPSIPVLCIEIAANTTLDNVERSWWMVERWREAIKAHLGPQPQRNRKHELYQWLYDNHRLGAGEHTYGELAEALNDSVEKDLRALIDWDLAGRPVPRSSEDRRSLGRYYAESLLENMCPRMSATTRRKTIDDAIQGIRERGAAFYRATVPITARHVDSRLKQYRKEFDLPWGSQE